MLRKRSKGRQPKWWLAMSIYGLDLIFIFWTLLLVIELCGEAYFKLIHNLQQVTDNICQICWMLIADDFWVKLRHHNFIFFDLKSRGSYFLFFSFSSNSCSDFWSAAIISIIHYCLFILIDCILYNLSQIKTLPWTLPLTPVVDKLLLLQNLFVDNLRNYSQSLSIRISWFAVQHLPWSYQKLFPDNLKISFTSKLIIAKPLKLLITSVHHGFLQVLTALGFMESRDSRIRSMTSAIWETVDLICILLLDGFNIK